MAKARIPVEHRFWPKVFFTFDEDSCWPWIGSVRGRGYGQFGIGVNNVQEAHRVSYRLVYGQIPDGTCVCHKCDNPACVRPDHLWIGTYSDNINDCYRKGRMPKKNMPRGEKHYNHVLTEELASEIRAKYLPKKYTQKMLAKEYGVHQATFQRLFSDPTRYRHQESA